MGSGAPGAKLVNGAVDGVVSRTMAWSQAPGKPEIPTRVLEQGPDRQHTPDDGSGGVSSMNWSLPGVVESGSDRPRPTARGNGEADRALDLPRSGFIKKRHG
jgi:hypothetical protein